MFSNNQTHTVCHCSHLTNFALLFDLHGSPVRRQSAINLLIFVNIRDSSSTKIYRLHFFFFHPRIMQWKVPTEHWWYCHMLEGAFQRLVVWLLYLFSVSCSKYFDLLSHIVAIFLGFSSLCGNCVFRVTNHCFKTLIFQSQGGPNPRAQESGI